VLAAAAILAVGGVSQTASATEWTNTGPETAVTVPSVPFVDFSTQQPGPLTAASGPASDLIAAECNSGNPIYAASWWKYTTASATNFVAFSADYSVLGDGLATGVAILASNTSQVLACSQPMDEPVTAQGGPVGVGAGETVYVATYALRGHRVPDYDERGAEIRIYFTDTTGVPPANDTLANAAEIGALPYTQTIDGTLAKSEAGDPGQCEGSASSVWWSYTAPATEQIRIRLNTAPSYSMNWGLYRVTDSGLERILDCGEGPDAYVEAGQRYAIMVSAQYPYNFVPLILGAKITLTVDRPPATPVTSVTVNPQGVVNKKTGVATVKGTVTCTGSEVNSTSLTGELSQVYKRNIFRSPLSAAPFTCTGRAQPWTATAYPVNGLFTGGSAQVTITGQACNESGCGSSGEVRATVTLKLG